MAYKLTVTGVVSFDPIHDRSIIELLLGEQSDAKIEVGIQNLEEQAHDIRVEMYEMPEGQTTQ